MVQESDFCPSANFSVAGDFNSKVTSILAFAKANENLREWRVGHSDTLADKKTEICWTVSVAGVAE